MGLYPSIPHKAGLKALREVLDKREELTITKNDLIRMVDFFLKKNYFEFNGQIKQQISGTVFGTKLLHLTCDFLWTKLKLLFLNPRITTNGVV